MKYPETGALESAQDIDNHISVPKKALDAFATGGATPVVLPPVSLA